MTIVFFIVFILALINVYAEYKRTLMMLQQNSYRNERYMKWLRVSGDSTSGVRLFAMIVMLLSLIDAVPASMGELFILIATAVSSQKLFKAKYKKPLVFTNRVWRIFAVMTTISIAILALIVVFMWKLDVQQMLFTLSLTSLVLYICSHIIVLAANTILRPVEKSINKKYYNDAARILASMT